MIHKFFDKKSSESGAAASLVNTSATEPNYQLANELDKQIIKTFKRWKVYSSFRNDIWGVDLVYMQSLRKQNKGVEYLLCAIDLLSKYAWVVPLKDKRGITIVSAFNNLKRTQTKENMGWSKRRIL